MLGRRRLLTRGMLLNKKFRVMDGMIIKWNLLKRLLAFHHEADSRVLSSRLLSKLFEHTSIPNQDSQSSPTT
jgi:hypothetical protein